MSQIGSWNGHTFEVSDRLIRGFTELQIQGGCETTEKNTNEQKYIERKYGNAQTISLVVGLNALAGVTDVYAEAMQFISEAVAGETAYFYLGSRKLLPCQLMLTQASVVEIVTMPGRGDVWISANVRLSFQQGSDNDGGSGGSSGSSGGGSGGTGSTAETSSASASSGITTSEIATFAVSTALSIATGNVAAAVPAVTIAAKSAMNYVKNLSEKAKSTSAKAKDASPALGSGANVPARRLTGGKSDTSFAAMSAEANKITKAQSNSGEKTNATTGRSAGSGKVDAITMTAPTAK